MQTETDFPRPLEALGISDTEERVYRLLLTHRMSTAEDIANLAALSPRRAQQLLDSIEEKGLATHSPVKPPRYIAAPPEVAVEALVQQRQAVLGRARLVIPELSSHASINSTSHEHEHFVEVVTNLSALGLILTQLNQTAKHEMLGFQLASRLLPNVTRQEIPRGLRIRSISDAGFLDLPGSLDRMRLDISMGEEARTFSTLPFKMIIADRRMGLISLNAKDVSGPMLLIRSSALLNALCLLFELIWEKSTPIVLTRTGQLEIGRPSPRLTDAAAQLIPLLAVGLNDKKIATETGMSVTTLNRRIARMMRSCGARTRFQLGWRAALEARANGLLPSPSDADLPLSLPGSD